MHQILNSQGEQLRQLIDKSQELTILNRHVQQLLSTELAPHCTVANFQNGCLVIAVDNAAWATCLRYQIPELLQQLRTKDQLPNLRTIRSYVNTQTQTGKQQVNKPPQLSARSADNIVDGAKHINHKDLRNALLQLAKA